MEGRKGEGYFLGNGGGGKRFKAGKGGNAGTAKNLGIKIVRKSGGLLWEGVAYISNPRKKGR